MDSFEYALTTNFAKSLPDFRIIIEIFIIYKFVESLLLVVPFDLRKDDLDRVILGRIGRIEYGNYSKFLVDFHDFWSLVNS